MDDLTYQIDVSDSFDSGNGSDDEEEDTEAENSRVGEDIDISVCHICSQVVCKVRALQIERQIVQTTDKGQSSYLVWKFGGNRQSTIATLVLISGYASMHMVKQRNVKMHFLTHS